MSFTGLLAFKKSFPKEEKYSLTDQIRRSSRRVSATISEAYRKRLYPKHFISKLSDADAENSEIGKLIHYMMNNPLKFGAKQSAN